MSDIFISYAKTDHALALRLSAFLEAEGWTVWWDNSLGAADLYRGLPRALLNFGKRALQ